MSRATKIGIQIVFRVILAVLASLKTGTAIRAITAGRIARNARATYSLS